MRYGFIRGAFSVVVPLILASCASGYQTFCKSAPGATPEIVAAKRVAPPPEIPILERLAPTNPETILAAYNKRGYASIGCSIFNSGRNESEASALKQGKAVGADLVLVLNPQYSGSITTNLPITTPTSTTSYTTGSATTYGPGGAVTAYGNAATTT
jgi:hypothetical protein